jgi:DNA-binding FrmR family transcriptional regulator
MGECCHTKHTPRSEELKRNVTRRLNRAIGQLGGIKTMVEEDRYCGDVLTQLAAVESALRSVSRLVAEFIASNPCCDKSELPGGEETLKHLAWLVSTGHVVSFTNGVYSQVEKFPKYGPQWKKRAVEKAEVKTEEAELKEEVKNDEAAPQLAE